MTGSNGSLLALLDEHEQLEKSQARRPQPPAVQPEPPEKDKVATILDKTDGDDSSYDNSSDDYSAAGGTTTSDEMTISARSKQEVLAHKETKLVNCSKMLVVMVVSFLAALVGLAVFFYVRHQEEDNYNNDYDIVVHEITNTCQQRTRTILDNLETVSVSLTTQANQGNMVWPFVVFPDFQVQGMISNQVTGSSTLTIHPIVPHKDRGDWETFSVDHASEWFVRAHMYDQQVNPHLYDKYVITDSRFKKSNSARWDQVGITPTLWRYDDTDTTMQRRVVDDADDFYAPVWQRAPAEDFLPTTNLNFAHLPQVRPVIQSMINNDQPALTVSGNATYLASHYYEGRFDFDEAEGEEGPPHNYLFHPIHDNLFENRSVVGFLSAYMRWDTYFVGALPESETAPILLIVDGTCENQTLTFELVGEDVVFLGESDLHDPIFEHMKREILFDAASLLGKGGKPVLCQYSARIYPTVDWADNYFTDMPMVYAVLVILCFLITTLLFAMYDFLVQQRQNKVMETAAKTSAIVSSLFPSNVRDRLLEELGPSPDHHRHRGQFQDEPDGNHGSIRGMTSSSRNRSILQDSSTKGINMADKSFANIGLGGGSSCRELYGGGGRRGSAVATSEVIFGSKPIADLFPATTIMFADMSGFTAWSSTREPQQVFTLLETVYHAFDTIAKRRRIFKVETIGDCYVAVSGLPVARKDHAVAMARFASECRAKMNELTAQLEKSLGPDTADLALRTGLHSGPVTAGVLRGEKGRFQLFGDTMNTASRMESTGDRNKIQVSSETADLLIAAGKSAWVVPRDTKVHAKGKGELNTFWLVKASPGSSNAADGDESHSGTDLGFSSSHLTSSLREDGEGAKLKRLVDYNVDILAKLLHQIVVRRVANPPIMATRETRKKYRPKDGLVLDEAKDILALPQFDANTFKKQIDADNIMLSPRVHAQLELFVTQIASLYRDNSFHNFEHASHVTMSVTKLLSRIVNPNGVSNRNEKQHKIAKKFHDHTFGITSDPLTHFATILSALIHDADHPGVSNAVLVNEMDCLAIRYNEKSVAEQNSIDLSWGILMQPDFDDLRSCIYANEEEFLRFRQVIVNIVLATDIMDKELGALRKARWEKAFSSGSDSSVHSVAPEDPHTNINRKATIVLEHLMQASDVAHTMQHWHVYLKWNERLFHEMYRAYLDGRVDKDPSESWYEGEIGFFDFYVIPLAKKLETCGVFGVSSDEYLSYAEANRNEWISKGEEIVKSYLAGYIPSTGKATLR